MWRKRNESTSGQTRANPERVRISNFVRSNQLTQLVHCKRAGFEDSLSFFRLVNSRSLNETREKEITVFIRETGRSNEVTKRNHLAAGGKIVTSFLVQLAQGNGFDLFWVGFDVVVDLAGRHRPDGSANRDAFFLDQHKFSIGSLRSDNDSGFSMNDGPRPRFRVGGRLHHLGHDREM